MRLLLDTQVLLWAVANPKRIPLETRRLLSAEDSDVFYSLGSIWEIAIKSSLGKLAFDADLIADTAEKDGIACLAIRREHITALKDLPWLHRDPFDRLLVSQSIVEPLVLLTADALLLRYGPFVRFLG